MNNETALWGALIGAYGFIFLIYRQLSNHIQSALERMEGKVDLVIRSQARMEGLAEERDKRLANIEQELRDRR